MNRFTIPLNLFLIVLLAIAATSWQQSDPQAAAGDQPQAIQKPSPPKLDRSTAKFGGHADEQAFPVLHVDDVVYMLTTACDDLIKLNAARTTAQLRPDLERTRFPLALPKPATVVLKPDEIYRKSIESIFLVAGITRPKEDETSWQTAFSTAFVIHEDGILATSAHVFDHEDPDDAVVVMNIQGQVYPVQEVLAADRSADTCLFRIGKKGLKPLPLGVNAGPGSAVRVIGHPGDSFYFFSAGYVANYEKDESGSVWMNVTADFGQGSSGGPTMDEAGNVIGQVSRTYTLYAGGETRQRSQRRTVRQTATPDTVTEAEIQHDVHSRPDPQMVFKACTPVSAIRKMTQ